MKKSFYSEGEASRATVTAINFNKRMNEYLNEKYAEQWNRALGLWEGDRNVSKLTIIQVRVKNFLFEIRRRISYAWEALKGNYGNEDY